MYQFTYLSSNIPSTESNINILLRKVRTAIDRLWIIWKSDLIDKIKWYLFQSVLMSVLLYVCTTWTVTKCMERKLDRNYTRMLCAVLNKSWKQYPTKQQLFSNLHPISQTIQVR